MVYYKFWHSIALIAPWGMMAFDYTDIFPYNFSLCIAAIFATSWWIWMMAYIEKLETEKRIMDERQS